MRHQQVRRRTRAPRWPSEPGEVEASLERDEVWTTRNTEVGSDPRPCKTGNHRHLHRITEYARFPSSRTRIILSFPPRCRESSSGLRPAQRDDPEHFAEDHLEELRPEQRPDRDQKKDLAGHEQKAGAARDERQGRK